MSLAYIPRVHPTQPGEVTLKAWLLDECARLGKSRGAIYGYIRRGRYPELSLRRVNRKVVFVKP